MFEDEACEEPTFETPSLEWEVQATEQPTFDFTSEPTIATAPVVEPQYSAEQEVIRHQLDDEAEEAPKSYRIQSTVLPEEIARRNEVRASKIQEITSRIQNAESIAEYESQPAYLRRNVEVSDERPSQENNISRFGLSGSGNNSELSCVFSKTVFAVATLPYREVSSTSASANRTVVLVKAIEFAKDGLEVIEDVAEDIKEAAEDVGEWLDENACYIGLNMALTTGCVAYFTPKPAPADPGTVTSTTISGTMVAAMVSLGQKAAIMLVSKEIGKLLADGIFLIPGVKGKCDKELLTKVLTNVVGKANPIYATAALSTPAGVGLFVGSVVSPIVATLICEGLVPNGFSKLDE